MKYFRIKIGYGNDEFISIDETELSRAFIIQINGKVAIFSMGSISGNYIISITPDFQREMSWARDYELKSEDYSLIGKKRINEYRQTLDTASQEAQVKLSANEKSGHLRLSSSDK